MARSGQSVIRQTFKIPYGERDRKLLHVSEVDRGLKCGCVCPVCRDRLVARKGAKTTHHFAHYAGSYCNAETALHVIGKRLLFDRISRAISGKYAILMAWDCGDCRERHAINMVEYVEDVAMEKHLGSLRPDLTLVASGGRIHSIVEVVVTHTPDENVSTYVEANGVPLIEFRVKTADDLENMVKSDALEPTKTNLCLRPRCRECRRPLNNVVLHVVEDDCWKCGEPMKIAILDIEGLMRGPEDFLDIEVAAARELGAELRVNYSKTMKTRYLSSTCKSCGAFSGSFFLHHYFDLITPESGVHVRETCLYCDERVEGR